MASFKKSFKEMVNDSDFQFGLFMGLWMGVVLGIAIENGPEMVAGKQRQRDAWEKGLIGNSTWWQNTIDWWRAYNGDFSR